MCFVGHLAAWQGVEFLIYASPLILGKCPEIRFLVVGDGVMRDKLLELVSEFGLADKFVFTGRVPYECVPLYINAADVCVAPFIRERNSKIGLSALKTYEYLACGYYHHSEHTFFEEISSLPPGSTMTYQGGQVNIKCYWDLPVRVSLKENMETD